MTASRSKDALLTLGVFVGSFALYAALRHGCYQWQDGWAFVTAWEHDDYAHVHHYLYNPIGLGFVRLGRWLGLDVFTSGAFYSAFGGALAIASMFLSLRLLRFDHRDALLAAALAGSTPAILLFSTLTGEPHAPYFGACGLAFLATALMIRKPTLARALLVSVTIAFARGIHGMGFLLVVQLLPWFVWMAWWRDKRAGLLRCLVLAAVAGAAVLPASLGIAWLVKAVGGYVPEASSLKVLSEKELELNPLPYAWVTWREWIWPYLAVSALALAAFFRRGLRVEAVLLHVALVPYVFLSFLILHGIDGRGSYPQALLLTASVVAVKLTGRRAGLVAVVLSLALAVFMAKRLERQRGVDLAYAAGAFAIAGDQPTRFLVWEEHEVDAIMLARPHHEKYLPVFLHNHTLWVPEHQKKLLPFYPTLLGGMQLIMSDIAERGLADPKGSNSGPILLEFFRKSYAMTPVESGPFRGKRLVPK